jgi:hypothetical protein
MHRRTIAKGVSLLEVLVGLLVSSIVAFALFELLGAQQNSYFVQDDISEMQQNLRIALERISSDLTMAGFGKPTPANNTVNGEDLSVWYSATTNPAWLSVKGGNTLEILGCPPTPDGTVDTIDPSNPVVLTLKEPPATVAKLFNTSDRRDITIGGAENARIASITGNILTIVPLDPTTNLSAHRAGTGVYVLRHVTYSTGNANGIPVIHINEHRGAGAQQLAQFVTSLKVTTSGKAVSFIITGRTRNPDRATRNYITSDLGTTIALRNP